MWEHARRGRVGDRAGSAGGRLRIRDRAILYPSVCTHRFIPPVRISSTETFRVAGVGVISRQIFRVGRALEFISFIYTNFRFFPKDDNLCVLQSTV